jgi:transitional endoplasmic reticulum ATPase
MGLTPGQPVEILARARTVATVLPWLDPHQGRTVRIDGITRVNAGVGLDEQVTIRSIACAPASHVKLASISRSSSEPAQGIEKFLSKLLDGAAVIEGDRMRVSLFGLSTYDFKVIACEPAAPAIIQRATTFEIVEPAAACQPDRLLVYEDIGGLNHEVGRLREIVEIPLKHPEAFERLGVAAPRAVLLTGPAGVGKSLTARVLAQSAQAHFFATSGPEILNKHYNQAGTHLREIFEQALNERPSVIFIDDLERIACRHHVTGAEAEKYIATELLTLIDHLERNGRVVVIGSTSNADEIDPIFRRHGRFEREINVRAPKHKDRQEILEIHSRGLALADDVDLDRVAALTSGFVGADLSIVCQEAALMALRQKMTEMGRWGEPTFEVMAEIQITLTHFLEALRTVTPSMPESAAMELRGVDWQDIGGLHDLRTQLIEALIMPLRAFKLFSGMRARPVRGVLLHGPSGTGKTLLARALAKETDITFMAIKGSDVLGGTAVACERSVRDLFRCARQMAPSIIFFDEIDAMAWPRHKSRPIDPTERALDQLLSEIDQLEPFRGVIILGATHCLERVDPELLRRGRFDLLLEVPLPDSQALKEIFQIQLRDRPLAGDVDLSVLVKLAAGFSGADVEVACQIAATNVVKEHVLEKKSSDAQLLIAQRHLAAAIAEICVRKLEEK